MSREVMSLRSADNEYMHGNFHGALSTGIQYLQDTHGPDAVIQWLRQMTDALYNPVKRDLNRRGLVAVREYIDGVYAEEGGTVQFEQTADELLVHIERCPALTHMRENGHPVADMWVETTRTVYQRLTEGTDFGFELLQFDEQTGECRLRFYHRIS